MLGLVIGSIFARSSGPHLKKRAHNFLAFLEALPPHERAAKIEADETFHTWSLTTGSSGRPEEALSVLDRARPLYRQFRDDLTQLRLHWLEAKIAHRRGDLAEAETIFQQLWEEFRVRDLNQEVVLVSIELAEVLTKKGEAARAADLAAGCYSIMRTWGLRRDALAAWIVFQNALGSFTEGEALGELFGKVQEYFRRHWVKPGRFEPDL
jgi:ATP/maltotriose-dependent transcriptional regulator MalT